MRAAVTEQERHRRSEEIFAQASELEAVAEREAFLVRACAGDAQLLLEVRSLLEALSRSEGFLQRPVVPGLAGMDGAVEFVDPALGRLVGPYRLRECLGVGGMGRVYLAEREGPDFTQRVAVKLIARGKFDPDALRRFGNECRALASLEHPHVTRMIDGGFTDDGVPYIVMEYVDGEPIDQYCERKGLDVRARLDLFLDLCAAVSHVHRHSMLHRDIKPGNVMVDREGRVKLADFGIARVIDAVDSGNEPTTMTVFPMMTPQYASPEQLRGDTLSTASDVYALGVLLYRLLTGVMPFAETTSSPREQERLVSTSAPTRPSDRVRGEQPEHDRLVRSLRGDLDAIVLMALRTEPERRYSSVENFADDLRRHLGSQPVQARPDRVTYRMRKFVQRHRASVALGSLAALALLVAVIAVSGMYVRAEHARRAAEAARVQAEENARTAQAITDFMSRLFEQSDPNMVGAQELTATEMLEAGTKRVREELLDEPRVRVQLLRTLSEVHRRRGDLENARALALEAVEIGRAEVHDDIQLARSLVVYGIYLERLRNYDEALLAFTEAESLALHAGGPEQPELARIANCIGIAYLGKGELSRAVPHMERSLRARERVIGSEDVELAYYHLNLAETQRELGAYEDAAPHYARALELRERHLEANHPQLIFAQLAHGAFLNTIGESSRARTLLELALSTQVETYGVENSLVASLSWELGRSYEALGDDALARSSFEQALVVYRGLYGDGSAWEAEALCGLGRLRLRADDAAGARDYFLRAMRVLETAYGAEHFQLAEPLEGLGRLAVAAGDWEDAVLRFERALQLLEASLVGDHPRLRGMLERLAEAYGAVGRVEERDVCLQRMEGMRGE